MKSLNRVYAILLYAYPKDFRAQFGGGMQQVFRDRCRAVARQPGIAPLFRFLFLSLRDWFTTSLRERFAAGDHTGLRWSSVARHPAVIWLLAIFMCLFASTTMVRAYVIPSASMEQDLRVGDHVLVDKLHSKTGDVNRGDMIAFLYPDDPEQTYVKRVIGLPGDRIRLIGKRVIRNGRRLVEPYAEHLTDYIDDYRDNFPAKPNLTLKNGGTQMLQSNVANGEVVVPSGNYFVLGDNRDSSWDSRYFGFVPRENIVGKPWIVYWSYDAPTRELAGWNRTYFADVAAHFFTRTRWSRTLLVLHSLPAQEVAP